MRMQFIVPFTIITLFTTPQSLEGASHSLVGVVKDGMDGLPHDLPLLLDHLDARYTPHCLRVVLSQALSTSKNSSATMVTEKFSNNPLSQISTGDDNGSAAPKANVNIVFSPDTSEQVYKTISYIYRSAEKVNPVSCITFILSQIPDNHLLDVLTDKATKKRITRYFLLYSESNIAAHSFLLDQRLGKEENVAALVQEESQNKSYWCVLIRQLLHPSGSPQVLTVNRWSRDTGLASANNIFPDQMANFYGQKLTGSALSVIPYSDYERTEGSLYIKLKPCVNRLIIETLAEQFNFTYDMKVPADGKWGNLEENGHFNGIVGDLEFERAHFAFDLTVTIERSRNVDFANNYYNILAVTFLTAKSRPDPLWRKLITPFRGTVWVCVLVSVGGGSLLYHAIYHAQATLTSSRLLSSHAFMHVLASFLSQSLHNYLSLQAGKVFLGFWFLYAFLVTSYYRTSLTSTLAVPFPPSTIDTLEQLQQSGLYCGMRGARGIAYSLFATSDDPVYKHIFKQLRFGSTSDIMEKVAEGQYSFIAFSSLLQLLQTIHNNNPNRQTDIHMARDKLFPSGIAIATPQGAPYLRSFDAVLQRCFKSGLIAKWVKDTIPIYLKQKQQTSEEQEGELAGKTTTKEVVLNLNHLQGPFFLLFLGYTGGLLLLLLELFIVALKN